MKKGYITVLFTIAMALCMSLFLVMIYGVRENALRMRCKEAADISMTSAFGEYQKTLWKKYGLVFVDAGYNGKTESVVLSEEHFRNCMNANFDENPGGLGLGKDLLKLDCTSVETVNIRFATDDRCNAVKKQAALCMKQKYGLEYISALYNAAFACNEFELTADGLNGKIENAMDKLSGVKDNYEVKKWTDKLENAVTETGSVSPFSMLSLVVTDTSGISKKAVASSSLASKRDLNKGNYKSNDTGFADGLFFKEYLIEKCANYLSKDDETALSYETEYLIKGAESDAKNLSSVVNRILILREAANFASIYKDSFKMGIIRMITGAIAIILLSPELKEPLAVLVASAWAYIESLKDVKVLLKGGRVPLLKGSDDFYTDVMNSGFEGQVEEKGLSYEDYLRAFILLVGDDVLAERFTDLLELNVRKIDDNPYFRMDFCFDAWTVRAFVLSGYGYDYEILRTRDTEVK